MNKKRGIVLASGASKGAYEVGVLKYLLGDKRYPFNYICGSSVGAINAAYLAQYPLGSEDIAIEGLERVWRRMTDDSVYKRWSPFGFLHANHKMGLYNTRPLKKLIYEVLEPEELRKAYRKLEFVVLDYYTGEKRILGNYCPKIEDAILGSASMPVVFPPVKWMDTYLMDGGVRDATPVSLAIAAGCDEIVVITPQGVQMDRAPKPSLKSIAVRTLECAIDEIEDTDLLTWPPKNVTIYTVRPKTTPDFGPLDFRPRAIAEMIGQGWRDAQNDLCNLQIT